MKSQIGYYNEHQRVESNAIEWTFDFECASELCYADGKLERKNATEEKHLIDEMEKLREAKNEAIANFQSYTIESEQRIKQIKEQLDEQYRSNFDLLKFEVEKLKLENEQLEEQRIQLQREIIGENAKLRKIQRENEEREIQIRNTYEEQINKLTDDLLIVHRKSVEDGSNQAEVDILRERYRSLNERYHQLYEDSERRQYENDSKIRRLETEILERTLRGTRSAIHLQQLSMELEHHRKTMEFANAEREHYKSEIKRLRKEKLTSDGESMAHENSLTEQFFNQSLLIDKKLNQIDETIAQRINSSKVFITFH
uniref:Uncharacterized protein n=1 Tax=Parascaris univalens TaxID=6257 RepID=A0A915BW04_PARUN